MEKIHQKENIKTKIQNGREQKKIRRLSNKLNDQIPAIENRENDDKEFLNN